MLLSRLLTVEQLRIGSVFSVPWAVQRFSAESFRAERGLEKIQPRQPQSPVAFRQRGASAAADTRSPSGVHFRFRHFHVREAGMSNWYVCTREGVPAARGDGARVWAVG